MDHIKFRTRREPDLSGSNGTISMKIGTAFVFFAICLGLAVPGDAAEPSSSRIKEGLRYLLEEADGTVDVAIDPATGSPSLLRIPTGSLELEGTSAKSRTTSFFARYGGALGINDADRELEFSRQKIDRLGMTHLTYRQMYHGVPVFAAELKVHLDGSDHPVAVNGTFVPGIRLDPSPIIGPSESEQAALSVVAKKNTLRISDLEAESPELLVYRTGLVRGIEGANHLAWRIEISDGRSVREFVFVDAHSGIILDRHPGIHEINRTIHHETYGNRIWQEGDSTPYSGLTEEKDIEVNRLIDTSDETYNLYANITGGEYLSYNGLDRTMQTVVRGGEGPAVRRVPQCLVGRTGDQFLCRVGSR